MRHRFSPAIAALLLGHLATAHAVPAAAPAGGQFVVPQVRLDVPHREAPGHAPKKEYLAGAMLQKGGGQRAAAADPTPADLEESVEVRLSPRVEALAESLGGDPAAMFDWVRRNVFYTPVFGSVQGSEGCLLSRECSAHDTASLLIALFRVSDVPARYVIGRIVLEPELLRSALGDFDNLQSAAEYAASGGTPVTLLLDDNSDVAAVQLAHVWVEAHLDGRWVPFDGALKPTRFTPPIDAASEIGLDADAFVDVLATGAMDANGDSVTSVDIVQLEQMLDAVEENLEGFQGSFTDEVTVAATIGASEARPRRPLFDPAALRLLPPETLDTALPAVARFIDEQVSELPASARHQLLLELENPDSSVALSFTRYLPELADRRLTLGYLPATQADADLANASGGLYRAPPDQLSLRPQLYLQGELMEVGEPLPMGAFQLLRVTITEPNAAFPPVEHVVTAGTYAAIGLNLRRTGSENLRARREYIGGILEDAGPTDTAALDDALGEILHAQAQVYFALLDMYARLAAHDLDVVATRRPDEMLMALEPAFTRDAQNVPTETLGVIMTMDFRRNIGSFSSRTGSDEDKGSFQFATGAFGSALEHAIFEITHGVPSVSTVRLIDEANRQGIPLFAVDSRNLARVLPQLTVPVATRDDITSAVNAGNYVLTPQDPVQLIEWSGPALMSLDPASGDGGFFIAGGLAGGSMATDFDLYFESIKHSFGTCVGHCEDTSVEGVLAIVPHMVDALEVAENEVRAYEGGHRHWRPLSACARERINNLRRSTIMNRDLFAGSFGGVPGITGISDLRYHVPSLSAFVFRILADELDERRREQGVCELSDAQGAS